LTSAAAAGGLPDLVTGLAAAVKIAKHQLGLQGLHQSQQQQQQQKD
jgi:hypothetical protein